MAKVGELITHENTRKTHEAIKLTNACDYGVFNCINWIIAPVAQWYNPGALFSIKCVIDALSVCTEEKS